MRDYDKENAERHKAKEAEAPKDRRFKLGGEIFEYRVVVPVDVLESLTSDTPLVGSAYIASIRESCMEMIEDKDDAHKRFIEVVKKRDGDNFLTMDDLQAVFQGLVEDAFRRPTQASLPSGDTDANTGETSTGTSSTGPAVASAA